MSERSEYIKDVINSLVSDFLYYDRKEDSDLRIGEIDEAVRNGEITVDEMAEVFHTGLKKSINFVKH